jgi:hypothetical protein
MLSAKVFDTTHGYAIVQCCKILPGINMQQRERCWNLYRNLAQLPPMHMPTSIVVARSARQTGMHRNFYREEDEKPQVLLTTILFYSRNLAKK